MANQHTRTVKYKTEGGEETVSAYTFDVEESSNIELEIPIGAADQEVTTNIPITAVTKGFALSCKKKPGQSADLTGELTVKTNIALTPDDTFVLNPTSGLSWDVGEPTAIPLTVAVTKLFVSNTGSGVCLLAIRTGLDATP